jgi:LPS-assembly protein
MRGRGLLRHWRTAVAGLLTAVSASAVLAQTTPATHSSHSLREKILGPSTSSALLRADEITYDTKTDIVTAIGHVEIDYNGRILTADNVVYDQDKDVATADGHVVIMAPGGDVVFAQHAVLTDEMKDGTMDAFSALIGPNGRMAAVRAERMDGGTHTIGARAIYTPCKMCKKRKDKPLWDIKADRVYYDEVHHRIYYHDATLQALGMSIFYTPYYTTPDPTVKHATGFLMPYYGNNTTLGTFVRVPYYIAFSDSQDATVAAYYATHGGGMLEGEYRERWDHGGMWFQASATDTPYGGVSGTQNQLYSSFFGYGRIPIDDTWHVGFDAQLTSNETYLDLYNLSELDRLTNDLFVEGLYGRSRFELSGYFFQGLRATDINSQFPVVLPLIEYSYIPEKDVLGGTFRFDLNTAAVSRQDGVEDQRVTGELNWKLPVVTGNGQIFTFVADLRGDEYHVDDAPLTLSDKTQYYVSRGLPYVALDWRWPLATNGFFGASNLVVTPITQFIYSPYGDNPSRIPNEDSTDFQLDETNVFSIDPLPGYDLAETGPRANVGVRADLVYPTGSIDMLLGQIYRLKPDPIFEPASGLSGTQSDYVGQVSVNFLPHLNVAERVDVTPNGTLERNEVYVNAVYGRDSLQLSYLRLPEEEVLLGLGSREEINGQATVGLFDHWIVYAGAERDLAAGEMIADEGGLGYEDECFGISLNYRRTYTTDRNVPPSTAWTFRVELKTQDNSDEQSDLFPRQLYSSIAL